MMTTLSFAFAFWAGTLPAALFEDLIDLVTSSPPLHFEHPLGLLPQNLHALG